MSTLRRAARWLLPGLGVKRWVALILLGLLLEAFGAVLLLNIFAYELTAELGGPDQAMRVGAGAVLGGLVLVGVALVALVRNIARATLPDEKQLVDKMLNQRKLGSGVRIVALGGGTGLSSLLRGLKAYTSNLTAVVVVSDDGGSSGRLRKEMPSLSLPPGDIRNCLAALADEEPLMTQMLQYRFADDTPELAGHSLGNLLIAALEDITGDFEEAIRETSRVLAIRGSVLPPTLESVTLCARLTNGALVCGESNINKAPSPIDYIYLDPPTPEPLQEAIDAILAADLIVIGPGSLYTSIIPNLLVPGIAAAISQAQAQRVYVCNVMTQPNETLGMGVAAHVEAILRHTSLPVFEYVLMNSQRPHQPVLQRYDASGAAFIEPDARRLAQMNLMPIEAPLLADDNLARHDPERLARALMQLVE